jgi:hypothetical protein
MNGITNETTAQLVALYAAHGADGVKNAGAFQSLCDTHDGDSGFDATLNDVKKIAVELQRNVDGHKYPEQVRFSLETLYGFKQANEREILSALVRARYFASWSDEQRNYFEWAAERLGWRDYFLSFTSYNPTDEINVVNSTHKYLIRDQIPTTWQERQDDSRANLLAHMLDNALRRGLLEGFYWERHKGDSTEVEEKLTTNAQESLTFIQILQSAMFVKQPPPSFCHLEYRVAVADESKTLVFVRAEPADDFIKRFKVDIGLRDWYDDIANRDPFELAPTRTWAAARIQQNLEGIRDNIIAKVEEARERLFTGVPQ